MAVTAWNTGMLRSRRLSTCNDFAIIRFPFAARGFEVRQHHELYSMPQAQRHDNDKPSTIEPKMVRIYSRPSLYDLAFGYRDFEMETTNLLKWHEDAALYPATMVLEVAAGPARHCMELDDNTRIAKTYAVDNSPEMKEYCASLRTGQKQPDKLEYLVQDMTQISLPTPVDTAWLLLGSLQHIVTLADAIQCFKSVHSSLNDKGTFILELPHPSEIFKMVDCTTNTWTIPLELSDDDSSTGGELKIIWGDADDEFDPINHIRHATVGFHLMTTADGQDNEQWMETVPLKSYTVPELYLLAELTGFRIVQLHGALDSSADEIFPIDDEDLAYRLVCVLQKL
jgi:Methyltransferase domain